MAKLVLRNRYQEIIDKLASLKAIHKTEPIIKDKEAYLNRLDDSRENLDFEFKIELAKAEKSLADFRLTD